jgi:hypothetical protein
VALPLNKHGHITTCFTLTGVPLRFTAAGEQSEPLKKEKMKLNKYSEASRWIFLAKGSTKYHLINFLK